MYIDGVIVFSLFMILLILVMMAYVGVYAYRHIVMDSKKAKEQCRRTQIMSTAQHK